MGGVCMWLCGCCVWVVCVGGIGGRNLGGQEGPAANCPAGGCVDGVCLVSGWIGGGGACVCVCGWVE